MSPRPQLQILSTKPCSRNGASVGLITVIAQFAFGSLSTIAAPPRAADFVPENAVIAITLRNGDEQAKTLRSTIDRLGVLETNAYATISSTPEFLQAQIGLAGVASAAKLDAWGAVGAALGREAVVAIGMPEKPGGKPRVELVIVPRDTQVVDRLLEIAESMTGLIRRGEPDPARSRKIGDVTVFQLAPELVFCRKGEALLIANDGEILKKAMECCAAAKGRLSDAKTYRDAEQKVPSTAVAWAMVDSPRLRAALHGEQEPPDKIDNPLGGFLFGGWWFALRTAESAVAWIEPESQALTMNVELISSEPLPTTHRGFAPEAAKADSWDERKLPGYLGSMQIARDWRSLFAERESILTLSAAGDLVNFSNSMTTLFGLDFLEELLPIVNGPIRLIAVQPDFSNLGYLPSPRLPSFALAIPMRFDAGSQLPRRLHSGSQTALSLINADAMQKGEPTYLLDMDRYRDVRLVYSEFPAESGEGMMMQRAATDSSPSNSKPTNHAATPAESSGEDMKMAAEDGATTSKPAGTRYVAVRYNFAMAAAVIDNEYVVATSRRLLEQIIDASKDQRGASSGTGAKPIGDTLRVEGNAVVALLRNNREELVAKRMLEQDRTRRQAEDEVDAFLELASFGERLELTTSVDGRTQRAVLSVRVSKPAPASESTR